MQRHDTTQANTPLLMLIHENYANPPIPKGYKHVCGEWFNGYVIERTLDTSQFVWDPVGSLSANGTLDGTLFNQKFGRRNYKDDQFSCFDFHEPFSGELVEQFNSIQKYGGYYISRFNISKNRKTGKPQSIKGQIPWTYISPIDAQKIAATFEISDDVTSHLPFGAEYDSLLEWSIQSHAKTLFDVALYSYSWGNHSGEIALTGSNEDYYVNNIADLCGNVDELTQERYGSLDYVVRGTHFDNDTVNFSVASRTTCRPQFCFGCTGFRIALCIK